MSVIRSHPASYLVAAVVVVVVVWGAPAAEHTTATNHRQEQSPARLLVRRQSGLDFESSPTSGASSSNSGHPAAPTLEPQQLEEAQQQQLPKPTNVSLVIVSWYPPLLRLSWRLHDPQEAKLKLRLYDQLTGGAHSGPHIHHNDTSSSGPDRRLLEDLDKLELDEAGQRLLIGDKLLRQMPELEELRQRKILVRKWLNCFQITYNIVNSRFKTSEELPAHTGWLHLVNLLPATEYSLQVAAVYVNGLRTLGERIQFVTPADNESRRFKDNSYRPIHRYPDEGRADQRGARGLEQARLEELTIVAFALLFWVATICLFFNKWGKIRMLEPYQPAYREADSPAPPFVAGPAHHSSLHQLGSGGGGGSGAKLATSLCGAVLGGAPGGAPGGPASDLGGPASPAVVMGAAGCKLAGCVSPGAGCTGNGLLSSTSGGSSAVDGALVGSLVQAGEFAGGPGKPAPPRRLATPMRRTQTESAGAPEQKQHRRTEAELNLLFQSKASALANAANLWTVRQQQQQRQKLRQHQYRTTQRLDLETLRRTSKALLRQGQLSCCPYEGALVQSAGAGNAGARVDGQQQRLHRQRPAHHEERCLSVELGGSHGSTRLGGRAALAVDQQTSKLLERRLLFISKSHQHHHVATSASSGTLRKESSTASAPPPALGQVAPAQAAETPTPPQSTTTLESLKPNSVSLDTPGQLESGPASGARKSVPGSGGGGCERTGGSAPQMACLRGLLGQVSRDVCDKAARPLHHIHIEPPSPPSRAGRHQQQLALGNLLDDSSSALQLVGWPAPDFHYEYSHQSDYHLHRSGSVSSGCGGAGPSSGGANSQCRAQPPADTCHDTTQLAPLTADRSRSAALVEQQQELIMYSHMEELAGNGGQLLDNRRRVSAASCQPRDRPAICVEAGAAEASAAGRRDTCPDYCNGARSSTDDGSPPHDGPTADEMSADDELASQQHPHHEESRDAFERLRDSSRQARHRHANTASSQLTAALASQLPAWRQGSTTVVPRNRSSSSSLAELACYLRPKSAGLGSGALLAGGACSLCSGDARGSSCAALSVTGTSGGPLAPARGAPQQQQQHRGSSPSARRPRLCSVFVGSSQARSKRGSFAVLHALSQKKSKSAEDVAHLSSLVLEIWARVDRNPLLQSVSHQQLASNQQQQQQYHQSRSHLLQSHKLAVGSHERHQQQQQQRHHHHLHHLHHHQYQRAGQAPPR